MDRIPFSKCFTLSRGSTKSTNHDINKNKSWFLIVTDMTVMFPSSFVRDRDEAWTLASDGISPKISNSQQLFLFLLSHYRYHMYHGRVSWIVDPRWGMGRINRFHSTHDVWILMGWMTHFPFIPSFDHGTHNLLDGFAYDLLARKGTHALLWPKTSGASRGPAECKHGWPYFRLS